MMVLKLLAAFLHWVSSLLNFILVDIYNLETPFTPLLLLLLLLLLFYESKSLQ